MTSQYRYRNLLMINTFIFVASLGYVSTAVAMTLQTSGVLGHAGEKRNALEVLARGPYGVIRLLWMFFKSQSYFLVALEAAGLYRVLEEKRQSSFRASRAFEPSTAFSDDSNWLRHQRQNLTNVTDAASNKSSDSIAKIDTVTCTCGAASKLNNRRDRSLKAASVVCFAVDEDGKPLDLEMGTGAGAGYGVNNSKIEYEAESETHSVYESVRSSTEQTHIGGEDHDPDQLELDHDGNMSSPTIIASPRFSDPNLRDVDIDVDHATDTSTHRSSSETVLTDRNRGP
ncbi:hypothetical protein HK102_010508 [Quaeritorhiza haematococci]|nr:hypothetical protein HK102_010508 [Quaeritorhiza haematococci]